MDFRVKRLDPPVHDFGKAGNLGDISDINVGFAQGFRGAARRQDLEACGGKAAGKLDQSGLVGNGKQRTAGSHDGKDSGNRVAGTKAVAVL